MAYTPCRACGDTEVVRTVVPALEQGMQCVIVTCATCENRRSSYVRKVKAPPAT